MKRICWALLAEATDWARWPLIALAERRFERSVKEEADPGRERVLDEAIQWLCRAQDNSASADGGVARDFSLIHGWSASYPETTGYIIPTLLNYVDRTGLADLRKRARRMADWLVGIQLPCGGFQGGKVDSRPVVPVTFNTGQVLLGLAASEKQFGGYREPMLRAADWLVDTQDSDGCWRRHPTPFAASGEKTYDTHVAWGLLEAARVVPHRGYAEAALANVHWALSLQRENGWFDRCCLGDASKPLSHTIGYALRGVLEAYRFGGEPIFLAAARRTADGLLSAFQSDGRLPGVLLPDWSAGAKWVCLTGTSQIAYCWLMLFEFTQDGRYLAAALKANEFVRRTVHIEGPPEVRGAVKGSYPISGEYGRYQYLNWAAKFLADSLMREIDLQASMAAGARVATVEPGEPRPVLVASKAV